jgi:hypothetical protein
MKKLVLLLCLALLVGGLLLYTNSRDRTASAEASGAGSGSPEPPLAADTLQMLRERVAYQAGPTTEGQGASLLGIAAGGGNVRLPEIPRGRPQGSASSDGNTLPSP